jgi:hypothetical protein
MKQGTARCESCAKAHESDLHAANCTTAGSKRLCQDPASSAPSDPSQNTDQKLIMLPNVTAKCSDGSPIGFFFRPAPEGGQKNKLTIWLKGGAMCQDYDDCIHRQSSSLGSSKYWLDTYEGVAIQSTNKTTNPDFFDWNHVFMEYCSGDFWSGTSPKPINPFPKGVGGKKFVFSGQLFLSEVLDHLAKNSAFSALEELVSNKDR